MGTMRGAVNECTEPNAMEALLPAGVFVGARESQRPVWNVRAVGFISRPERVADLIACLEGPVTDLLRQIRGFASAIVLQSHKEERSVLVLTFWETKTQAMKNCWEQLSAMRELISPLVDVRTKVQTFQASVPYVATEIETRKASGTS
jgi:hypothetical protein